MKIEKLDFLFKRKLLSILLLLLILCPVISISKITRTKLPGRLTIHQRDLDTRNGSTKRKIVLIHNFYRTKVNPPASNMLQMTWHKGAEESAQKWANACQLLRHDKHVDRWDNDYGSCGQNIFVSSAPVDWMFVTKAWYLEHKNFTYGSRTNNLSVVGHYTQMVWYSSHRIGCGFRYCGKEVVRRPFYNYVCNYCPIGNHPNNIGTPYAVGKPCDICQEHCKYKKLCTNSCPYSDFWANCADLNSTFHTWLCKDKESKRYKYCHATCGCPNAIH